MSRYQELATVTEKLIADGLLRPGDRLPSIRRACLTHAISPITVSSAYQLLESRGLIEARPKSGYFVRARPGQNLSEPAMSQPGSGSTGLAVSDFIFRTLDSIKDSSVVPLGSSFPTPELFPLDRLGRSLAAAARQQLADKTKPYKKELEQIDKKLPQLNEQRAALALPVLNAMLGLNMPETLMSQSPVAPDFESAAVQL